MIAERQRRPRPAPVPGPADFARAIPTAPVLVGALSVAYAYVMGDF